MYFSAPLYRKNLHYSVLSKPNNFADAIKVTREFILNKHRNQSGIIYCLSKKVSGYYHLWILSIAGLICRSGCRARGEGVGFGKQWADSNGDISCGGP